MLRLRLRGLAWVLAAAFVFLHAPVSAAFSMQEWIDTLRPPVRGPAPAPAPTEMRMVAASPSPLSSQEWLDTIRPPLRADGPEAACPGIGEIGFEPGTAEPSADGRRSLDALATALASNELGNSKFQVLWLAIPEERKLAERRAGVVEARVRSSPSLDPTRLTLGPAPAAFEGCSRLPTADTLLLQVKIAGRWWGGQ